MVRLELVVHGVHLVLWRDLQAMLRRVSGALVLPLRGRVEATSEPSCPTPMRQAPATGFACLQRCCRSRVFPRQAVVPTVSSFARMLQGRGFLARAACLESLLVSVPPQLPALLERGWVVLLCRTLLLLAPPLHVELGHCSGNDPCRSSRS